MTFFFWLRKQKLFKLYFSLYFRNLAYFFDNFDLIEFVLSSFGSGLDFSFCSFSFDTDLDADLVKSLIESNVSNY
jgi:hypothetical protein